MHGRPNNWEGHCLRNPQKRSQTKTPTMIKAMHIVVWNWFHCLFSFLYSLKLAYTLSSMSFATHWQDCPLVVPSLLSLIWNLSVSFILFFRSFYHCFTLPINFVCSFSYKLLLTDFLSWWIVVSFSLCVGRIEACSSGVGPEAYTGAYTETKSLIHDDNVV